MSMFFTTARETNQAREDALMPRRRNLGFFDDPQGGDGSIFENVGRDIGSGFALTGEAVNELASLRWVRDLEIGANPVAGRANREVLRSVLPNEPTDWEKFFTTNRDDWARLRRQYTVDPATRSEAANLVGGLAGMLTTFSASSLTAGPFVGPVLAGTGFGRQEEERLLEQGVDPETARRGGQITGAIMAGMGFAPVAIPGRLLQRAASGAGINLVFGAGLRGSMNAYLTEQGYGEGSENNIAQNYQWLDPHAATIDVLLGAAFGALFGGRAPAGMRPHPDAIVADIAPEPPVLPETAEGYFDEARQYANDEMFAEAYAYALMAREMGHPEADGLLEMLADDASAADIAAARAMADEIYGDQNARAAAQEMVTPALVQADSINRRTAFGIPENQASRRWQSDAIERMEGQEARDEPIDPGPLPEDVGFVPHPDMGGAELEAAMRGFEEEARANRLDDLAEDIRQLREQRPDVVEPREDGALFSMGTRKARGVESWRGSERFYDERLTTSQNKAVEMARNNYTNIEIAEEMDTSNTTVSVLLTQAKQRAPDISIQEGRSPGPPAKASIESLVAMRDALRRAGVPANRVRGAGGRTILAVMAERTGMTKGAVKQRLFQYDRDVAEGRRAPLYSYGDGEGFSTVAELEARATEELGADWGALSRAAKVEVVQSSRDVPTDGYGDILPGVQAVTFRRGSTYFIANNIRPSDLKALILHEIGVHQGMPDMLGKRGWNEVLRQIERMVEEEHPAVMEVRGWAESGSAKADDVPEETLAYLIEARADLPLVNRVLSRLRQWLIKTFGSTFGMRLTIDDLRALAITSLRRVAEQARREGAPDGYAEVLVDPRYSTRETPDAPNAGNGGDFPQFSMGRQNRPDMVGAKRDPIESPDYQRRLADVRARAAEGGYDEAGPGRPGGLEGVSGDANAGRSARSDARSRRGPSRALIRDIRDISGVRLVTKERDNGFGAHRATIDTPFASEADAALHGEEGVATYVDFDWRDGSDNADVYPGLHIRVSSLNHAARGQKVGVWLYRQLIEWADRQGLPVYSDHTSMSPDAQRIYAALERRGYEVERVGKVERDEDGYLVSPDMTTPIYRVSKRLPIEEELTGAPLPREDYQIDGPTLRERQQRIDEQRARQEAYDKLPSHEQALRDDPDMKFSFGRHSMSGREVMENAKAESDAAREMRLAYEAAARCAARHGAGQAVRGVSYGVFTAPLSEVFLGHVIGAAAAIPAGITVSNYLARNENPGRYARNRARMAAEAVAQEEAEFARDGAAAGRRAGLDAPTTYNDLEGEPLWDNVDVSRRAGDAAQEPTPDPWQAMGSGNSHLPMDYEPNTFSSGGGLAPPGVDEPQTGSGVEGGGSGDELIDLFRPLIEGEE